MTRAEVWVSRALLIGGLTGIALMIAGVAASALPRGRVVPVIAHANPGAARAPAADTIVAVRQITRGLAHRPPDPFAVAALGIVTLLVTPLAAVTVAGLAFAGEGDRRFAVISAIVVAALLVSLWLGAA